MEVGKRLLELHSKYRELNGITATAYLDKAETMFREMDLECDLEQLERVRRTRILPVLGRLRFSSRCMIDSANLNLNIKYGYDTGPAYDSQNLGKKQSDQP
ncbi:MAG: hypothetical protein NTW27_13295 [Deltaproteobacteria bacterium]|nr:hypothetical protein [Deltaproteobacteria bacterium]